MAKEILLYSSIYSYSAEQFITAMEENKNNDVVLRINTNGGGPEDGFGMIAKFAEHKKSKKIKVDGKAYSMGLFFLAYSDDVEALDVTEFLAHRAAYPQWFEKSEYMTEALWDNLNRINSNLRSALEAKIDVAKFEKLKGVKMDDIFSNKSRVDVFLSAEEAKEIGLIDRIVKITPEKKSEIESHMLRIAAEYNGISVSKEPVKTETNKSKIMNLETLKADHPALYSQVKALGASEEKDRVGAWLAFVDVDPEAVSRGIKEGTSISQTAMAEFSRKAFSANALKGIEKDSPGAVKTDEVDSKVKTEKEKELEKFQAEVKAHLNLK